MSSFSRFFGSMKHLASSSASQIASIGRPYMKRLSRYQEPIMYWTKVWREFGKQVYRSEKIGSTSQSMRRTSRIFQDYSMEDIKRGTFIAIELLGIFSVGQMVGRRKITPYK
ncbi:F0-ATPase subunit G [Schizosaccharomyces japonicus yFS275]|uniref:F0-ATPase subunit G n=1 Tax=Schizosaccharomyces japonicus (strain yFS275 / FY16936) TaxID=402676 RepID=B6JX57_SCHJY|nr:F0-ATPase subunit G [Schizosaccharomyces japonicus yFS275]EEB05958.1 F0-ATPase subunit G [Schizosaccharomyces japonicus yFS275]